MDPLDPHGLGPIGTPASGDGGGTAPRRRRWVPIRSLTPRHRERIAAHLLSLDAHDRQLRFGHAANDAQILRHVEQLDFVRDELFGIFDRRLELIAIAHLALLPAQAGATQATAEFGVSVRAKARGRGHGARLFRLAVVHARNRGCDRMLIHALSDNTAMLKIAIRAGASVERSGPEAQAWLKLPAQDTASRVDELVQSQAAEWNYRIKKWVRDMKYVHARDRASHRKDRS